MSQQVFELKTYSLSEQKVTEDIRNVLTLTDKMLIWDTEFYCDEINGKTEVWEKDVYRCFYSRFMKSAITGVQVSNSDEEEGMYIVDIFQVSGNKILIYFNEYEKAREIADAIANWIFA